MLCVIQLSGCDGKGALVGTWELISAAFEGESIDVTETFAEMTLESDGTAKLITDKASLVSTWSYNNGELIIDDMLCEYDDGVISVNFSGLYMKFSRK